MILWDKLFRCRWGAAGITSERSLGDHFGGAQHRCDGPTCQGPRRQAREPERVLSCRTTAVPIRQEPSSPTSSRAPWSRCWRASTRDCSSTRTQSAASHRRPTTSARATTAKAASTSSTRPTQSGGKPKPASRSRPSKLCTESAEAPAQDSAPSSWIRFTTSTRIRLWEHHSPPFLQGFRYRRWALQRCPCFSRSD